MTRPTKKQLRLDSAARLRQALLDFVDHADEVIFEGNMTHAEAMLATYMELRAEMGREAVDNLRAACDLGPVPFDTTPKLTGPPRP